MTKKELYSSGAPWEKTFGYSRAVKVGNTIEVAGTTSVANGEVMYPEDPYLQTKHIFSIIEESLKSLGADLSHVVRTRIFMTDIKNFEAIGKAHGEIFSDIRPASTALEVSGFVNPKMLVEIEVTAVI